MFLSNMSSFEQESNDVEILWRLSRALHHMSKMECDNEDKKRYVFEGYDLILKAIQLNDSHYAVHKWYSIFLDARSAYDGIKARVTQLPNVKKHLLVCIDMLYITLLFSSCSCFR